MSQVHFVVYALVDGSVRRAGTCQDYDLAKQAGDGEGVTEATADAVIVAEINPDPVRNSLFAKIDADAEAARARFITPGSGQAMTYLAKQTEAAAYLANPAASTPFLTAEAAATGTTVAALAAVVDGNATAWLAVGAKIEAARRGAKMAVAAATNIAVMHAASQVDWAAVLA